MRFTAILTILAGVAVALPTESARTDQPDLDQIQIVGVNYGGSGCRKGTVTDILSDQKDLITLLFDEYIAESGPGVPSSKSRSACQLNIKLHFPQGWQFSVFKADYRGYVDLPVGVEGYSRATYYFSGDSNQVSRNIKFTGPVFGDYTKSDTIGLESTVWSPCGVEGLLNIKSAVDIKPLGTNKHALITVDSGDFKVHQLYHLQWRRCHK